MLSWARPCVDGGPSDGGVSDLAVPGGEGVEEVHVDAITGKVIAHEHEDEASEADEADESSR